MGKVILDEDDYFEFQCDDEVMHMRGGTYKFHAVGQRRNCISGIWITGRITGREGTGYNSKNGKASVIKVAGAFFVQKRVNELLG